MGLWLVAAAAPPVAVVLSLPSVFTIGAITLVGLYELLRKRTARTAFAFAGFLSRTGLSVAAIAIAGQYRTRPEDRATSSSSGLRRFRRRSTNPPRWLDGSFA